MNKGFLFRICAGVALVALSFFFALIPTDTQKVFMLQLGGLTLTAGIACLTWKYVKRLPTTSSCISLMVCALLFATPAHAGNISYGLLAFLTTAILLAYYYILRIAGRTHLASLFGAVVFGCSTWLPLKLITWGTNPTEMLSLRDALIDPNQISVSHAAGAYIGVPAAVFAVAGIIIWMCMVIRKRFTAAQADTVVAAVLLVSAGLAFVPSSIAIPEATSIVALCLAWFASLGFDRMQRFIGLKDTLVQILLATLLFIALLDLMHIAAGTMQYGLGI